MATKTEDKKAGDVGVLADQDFDVVFSALASGDPLPTDDPPADDKKIPGQPPAGPDGDPLPEDEAAKAAEAAKTAADAEKAAEAAKAAEAQKAADAAAKKAADEAKAAEEAAKAAEAQKAAEEAAKTAETKLGELLGAVAKDFPEVAEALEAARAADKAALKKEFDAALAELKQSLAPVIATSADAARSKHDQAILSKHADAFELLPEADKWIATQPAFLQATYNNVLDKGTAAEIVEFFDIFKAATGRTETPEDAAAKAAAEAAEAEKAKKLASQEGVRGRATQRKETLDPNDFEGAFEKLAASA